MDTLILIVNAFSPMTQGNAEFKAVLSNTFASVLNMVEVDILESEYLEEHLEASSEMLT